MAQVIRNFVLGRMNKDIDERLVPQGEHIDAENFIVATTEGSDIAVGDVQLGNEQLSTLTYLGTPLSEDTRAISATIYGSEEKIYWFVHDPTNVQSTITGKVDMVVSYDERNNQVQYHVISVHDPLNPTQTVLNFNPEFLITGVAIIDDLLFFTDNLNDPRRINRLRQYPIPIAGNDVITANDLRVIVYPPAAPPEVRLINLPSDINYIEEVFVAFAYRYKYKDGEYSCTSLFTDVQFQPNVFQLDTAQYLNAGMVNRYNGVEVKINTGDSNVVGVDVCYKLGDNNEIYVIEKFDKSAEGWGDNEERSSTFSNSKIYTILPSSEILRMYDNVPHIAKALTIMQTRLIYGNYKDGFDLIDKDGNSIQFGFTPELISQDIGLEEIPSIHIQGTYNLDPSVAADYPISGSTVQIDLDGLELVKGSALSVTMDIVHSALSGIDSSLWTTADYQSIFTLEFVFNLTQDYASVYEMVTSDEFTAQIGVTSAQIQSVAACGGDPLSNPDATGTTLTDAFNCIIVNPDGFVKKDSGVNAINTGFQLTTTTGSTVMTIQIPAMQFEEVSSGKTQIYEYYEFTNTEVNFVKLDDSRSLHSNWDFETAIIYMDDYNRATTALVSSNNTTHVPSVASETANGIRITIPTTQKPPYWATRYKFAVRPNKEAYDTIYSNLFYRDPLDASVWFRLDGENQKKVAAGDRLIVKADTDGALDSYVNVSVLDKVVQEEDFLTGNEDENGDLLVEMAGTYMRLKPNEFSADSPEFPIVGGVRVEDKIDRDSSNSPYVEFPCFEVREDDSIYKWDIPSGSIVNIKVKFQRKERYKRSDKRGAERCLLKLRVVATNDYDSFKSFWDAEHINVDLADCEVEDQDDSGANGSLYFSNIYDKGLPDSATNVNNTLIRDDENHKYQFKIDTTDPLDQRLWLSIKSGVVAVGGARNRPSVLKADIEVIRASSLLVFETEPTEAIPDVFFEGSKVFQIDQANGFHLGDIQDQTASLPAILDLEFFNCYSFGNGVESYKVRDSLIGRFFRLGQRVTAVTAQDFILADRFADLTYSGVYNKESNVNRLNEFNLGLLNFKSLEKTYGSIQLLDARATDILTLQEDKISYVLAGKNLLSDATGGGSLTSVPEVLGTQIARVEEFGISKNPESYVKFGADKYFTDAKRGALLKLTGSSAQNEQLTEVSQQGMKRYFRDLFRDNLNTQKVGGYSPAEDVYYLSSNEESLPLETSRIPCGQAISINTDTTETLNINVGRQLGDVVLDFIFLDTANIDINWDNGNTTGSFTGITADGSVIIPKTVINNQEIQVVIAVNTGTAHMNIMPNCPQSTVMTVVPICLNAPVDAGDFIHNEFLWDLGGFISPINSQQVNFIAGSSPLVADYRTLVNNQGVGNIPASGSTVTMRSNRISFDNYSFDSINDKFRFLFSNTEYLNNNTDINTVIGLSSVATPITGADPLFQSSFSMQDGFNFLYLIYDYRDSVAGVLCFDSSAIDLLCCDCSTKAGCTPFKATLGQTSKANTCISSMAQVLYHNGTGTHPIIGDSVFTDTDCLVPIVVGLTPWLGLNNGAAIFVDGTGLITQLENCTA